MAAQKKSKIASERDEQSRGLWRLLASHFDAKRLVFVEESGFNTSMRRLGARAPKGKRAYGKVPRNRGKNTTLIAAITLEGAMGASMTVEGVTDSLAFEAYVEHFLAPSLCEGQVVVLDGLGAHRTQKVEELIEGRGADLVFLPSYYSPDLNPIEEAFSKIKALVRKVGARARGTGRGDRTNSSGRHTRRCYRLVRPRRLSASGSTLMSTAVRSETGRYQR
jgi:transposase